MRLHVALDAIHLEGVTKRYGDREALSGVSFSVRPGESVAYLGPNGAGKSTTLKLLTGLAAPDSGTVRILGRDPRLPSGVARRPLGALVESPTLAPYLRGSDLFEYVAAVKGIAPTDRAAESERVATLIGLEGRLGSAIRSLSSGLARRLLIGAALVGSPSILLLDEPTVGLDPVARRDLRATLRTLHGSGLTLLLSTHLLEDVETICDRVLFLREGRLVGDEPVRPASSVVLRVRFLMPPSAAQLAVTLSSDETLISLHGTEAAIGLEGGDEPQADLLRRLVGGGFRPVVFERTGAALEERYLAAVGREDGP